MERLAIISVYNKEGLEPFAKGLSELGVKILSTGGTAKFLEQSEIPVTQISDYTGHPEILDGRVKSLHPKIHGGILARRALDTDLGELRENEISPIDFVIVNLYPFIEEVRKVQESRNADHPTIEELIDIGGPTMIRAAAKNCHDVVVICDPSDYQPVLAELKETGDVCLPTRRKLAAKVFATMSAYDGQIARYFSLEEKLLKEDGEPKQFAPIESVVLQKCQELRYGENPHQHAGLYRQLSTNESWWKQLQGKEISYNNLLDMHATMGMFMDLRKISENQAQAVIVKHSNPCGVAICASPLSAFKKARSCDPVSAFGGIVAVSGVLNTELAETILEGFVEIVLAEEISAGALNTFANKKNVRVIQCDFGKLNKQLESEDISLRNFAGDYLLQSFDTKLINGAAFEVVAGEKPSAKTLSDFEMAFTVCKHVKSNAIVIVKDGMAVGIGAGQMSRVDSARLAISRAELNGQSVEGGVAGSDAFLPFADTLEVLNDAGVVGLVQPGGSIKDKEVVEVANKRGVTMLLTGHRHFRH